MIAAIRSEDNRLRAGLRGGHISVATRQPRPFVQSEAFEAALALHEQMRYRRRLIGRLIFPAESLGARDRVD